jgi:ribose 5-phosphate isomerase B
MSITEVKGELSSKDNKLRWDSIGHQTQGSETHDYCLQARQESGRPVAWRVGNIQFAHWRNWNSPADSDRIAADTPLAESSSKPPIVVGSDHAGFRAKETIKKYLEGAGYLVDDVGTHSEESVDYPDYAKAVGERVAAGDDSLGVVVCATGIGVSIAANKVEGIRAALAHDSLTARRAREHNDANVIALGGKIVGEDEAIAIVQEFLGAQFAGGRHQRRIDKITEMDRAREHQS